MHGGLPPGYEDQQKFMCDQCTNVFFNEWSLKLHIKVRQKYSCKVLMANHMKKVYSQYFTFIFLVQA